MPRTHSCCSAALSSQTQGDLFHYLLKLQIRLHGHQVNHPCAEAIRGDLSNNKRAVAKTCRMARSSHSNFLEHNQLLHYSPAAVACSRAHNYLPLPNGKISRSSTSISAAPQLHLGQNLPIGKATNPAASSCLAEAILPCRSCCATQPLHRPAEAAAPPKGSLPHLG
ncbi:hypothetical protein L3X38_011792 [Prunus dulcis]|uniref:Uncharacterized protein n=1 Tax=Prunus dulcis TaxID=3755 RepID=A0AAD4WIT2_PRUDU|nr:hypothetical protein L3X38_011792 [Prunus dulcis]